MRTASGREHCLHSSSRSTRSPARRRFSDTPASGFFYGQASQLLSAAERTRPKSWSRDVCLSSTASLAMSGKPFVTFDATQGMSKLQGSIAGPRFILFVFKRVAVYAAWRPFANLFHSRRLFKVRGLRMPCGGKQGLDLNNSSRRSGGFPGKGHAVDR